MIENRTLRTTRDSAVVDHMTNGLDFEGQDMDTELVPIQQRRPQVRPSSMIEMRDPSRHHLMHMVWCLQWWFSHYGMWFL
jgi:hypothetical protein